MTKILKIITFISAFTVLSACEASYGDKFTVGNFELYYTQEVNVVYVQKTADYFEDNGLILDHKHSAQLSYDNQTATFKLKLILNPKYKKLPSDMIDDLLLLEDDMRTTIFDDLNFVLEICDEQFNPIKT